MKSKVILDAGAGRRATTTRILEKTVSEEAGGTVIAVEIVRNSLTLAKENIMKLPHKVLVTFITADSACLPLRTESVDLVLSDRAIADMNSPPCRIVKVLAELGRVLSKGGKIVLSDECPIVKWTEEEEMTSLRWRVAKAVSHLIGREHAHEVDPNDLEFIMKLVGFKEIKWRTFGGELLTPRRMQRFVENSMDLIPGINDLELRKAFVHNVEQLRKTFKRKNGLLPPRYVLHARK